MERRVRACRHTCGCHREDAFGTRARAGGPEVKERITALGGEASGLPPADTAKWLQAQVDKWARVVKDANIRLE